MLDKRPQQRSKVQYCVWVRCTGARRVVGHRQNKKNHLDIRICWSFNNSPVGIGDLCFGCIDHATLSVSRVPSGAIWCHLLRILMCISRPSHTHLKPNSRPSFACNSPVSRISWPNHQVPLRRSVVSFNGVSLNQRIEFSGCDLNRVLPSRVHCTYLAAPGYACLR